MFESHYVRNPEDRFCSVEAHLILFLIVLAEEVSIRTSFSIGDDEDDDEECSDKDSKLTQTDQLMRELAPLKRLASQQPPRALEECLKILRSDVSCSVNAPKIMKKL